MHTCRSKLISFLLALAMVLSLIPSGFALEAVPGSDGQTEPTLSQTDPADDPANLPEGPEDPADDPANSPQDPADPADDPANSPQDPADPADDPMDSPQDPADPADDPVDPPQDPADPADDPADSPQDPADPVDDPADSPQDPADPADDPADSVDELVPPVESITEGEFPVDDGINAIVDLPLEDPPAPSSGFYSTMSLDGIRDYSAAAKALDVINDGLESILSMDEDTQACAMLRAAELAVRYHTDRPTGEDWSTVLGDAGCDVTFYRQAIAYGSLSQAVDSWVKDPDIYSFLSSENIRSVGIGCFYQEDGGTYWVLIITNRYTSPATTSGQVDEPVQVSYLPTYLGTPKLVLSSSTLMAGVSGQSAKLVLSNGKDFFTPSSNYVSYSSSNSSIASVDSQGGLTAITLGTATISASIKGSSVSASANVTCKVTLATVDLGQISNQNGQVYLTWKAVTGANAYQVWRKVPGGSWNKVGAPVSRTNFTDTTVVSGQTYVYTVRAQHVTSQVSMQGDYDRTGLTILYLASPSLSSAKAFSSGITVTWKPVQGAASYDVYRKTSGTNWAKIGNVSGTTYRDISVTAKTQYTYTVRARSGNSTSYYVTSGVTATATSTVSTTVFTTRADTKYYVNASTSSKLAGTVKAGTIVNTVSGWSQQSGGSTWYMMVLNGTVYYIPSANLLAVPKISSVINATDGLKVSWNKVSNATGYCLYQRDKAGQWVRIATLTSNNTVSYIVPDKTLTSGSKYTFTVRCSYNKILGDYNRTGSSAVYVKAPELLSAVSNNKDQITVTWEKIPGATGYTLYRKSAGTNGWSSIATLKSGLTCSYQDKGVSTMTSYTYTVRASINSAFSYYDTVGISSIIVPANKLNNCVVVSNSKYYTGAGTNNRSPGTLKAGTVVQQVIGWSKTVNGVVWNQIRVNNTLYYIPSSALLATPTLTKIAASGNAVSVTWGKVSNATGYLVYRKTSNSGWVRIANLSSSRLSYTDDSLSSGTTYIYTVRALRNSVLSDYDRTGISLRYLSMPKLTGTTVTRDGITVRWSRVTGAQGYYIYRKVSGSSWVRIGQSGSNALSYQDTKDLLKGTTYYYTVRAISGNSMSYYSTSGISGKASSTLNPVTKSYVTTGDLNYRDKPSTGNVIGTFSKGTTVQVVPSGTVTVNGSKWYMVYLKGNCYYASASWLKEK